MCNVHGLTAGCMKRTRKLGLRGRLPRGAKSEFGVVGAPDSSTLCAGLGPAVSGVVGAPFLRILCDRLAGPGVSGTAGTHS